MKKLLKEHGVLIHKNPNIKLNDIEYADDGVIFSEDQHAAIKHIETPPPGRAKALRASSLQRYWARGIRCYIFMILLEPSMIFFMSLQICFTKYEFYD
jgi:hypothetical protein